MKKYIRVSLKVQGVDVDLVQDIPGLWQFRVILPETLWDGVGYGLLASQFHTEPVETDFDPTQDLIRRFELLERGSWLWKHAAFCSPICITYETNRHISEVLIRLSEVAYVQLVRISYNSDEVLDNPVAVQLTRQALQTKARHLLSPWLPEDWQEKCHVKVPWRLAFEEYLKRFAAAVS